MIRTAAIACACLLPTFVCAQESSIPTVEDLRGALFVCSGGSVIGRDVSVTGDVEAFVRLLRRNLEGTLEAEGRLRSEDIGKIFEQTFAEGERVEVFRLYNDCLQNFVGPLISGSGGSGPGIQSMAAFDAILHEAYSLEDLVLITLGLSNFNNVRYLGVMPGSFRGVSSIGTIYTLGDSGGLVDCTESTNLNNCGLVVSEGDNLTIILTFEKVAGPDQNTEQGATFSFSGNIVYAGNQVNLGMRRIPLVSLR